MTPLIDPAYCQSNAFLTSQSPQELNSLLAAASTAIRKFCWRNFTQQNYTIYVPGPQTPYDIIMLTDKPIIQVTRLATNPTVVLQVYNNNSAYQRATIAVSSTGITLFTMESGVASTNTSITFALYPTLQAAANAINALGTGWTATPVAGYELYPSADLKVIQGAMTATQNKGGAGLEMYLENCVFGGYGFYSWGQTGAWIGSTLWRVDLEKGVIFGSLPPSLDGNPNIRIDYTGGFNPIPDDVQRACMLTAISIGQAGKINPMLTTESALDYSYTLNTAAKMIPPVAREILASYRDPAAKNCITS